MKSRRWKLFWLIVVIALCIIAVKVAPIIKLGYQMYHEAIDTTSLQVKVAEIQSDDSYAKLDEISPFFITQVIESEDRRFYDHKGINLSSTARAFLKNIETGTTTEGGSSITQQLAKNMYFSFEKRYERKVAELFVAFDLEKAYSKNEILELYCNIAYFGEGCYGIKEATLHYYGIEPNELTLEQAEILVKTLKSPNIYNPNTLK